MAINCYPTWGESGTLGFGDESYSMKYVVEGTSSGFVATTAVLNIAPPAVIGISKTLYRQPVEPDDQKGGVWHVTVNYKPADSDDNNNNDDDQATPMAFKLSWDTSGGTTKITESLKDPDGGGIYQDTGRVIGSDGKKVNGCDITVPQLTLTVDVFYLPSFITNAAVTGWARATGKTNSDAWLGFEPGECLLLGCTGEQTFSMLNGRATKPAPVSFKVGCSENIPAPFTVKSNPANLVANGGKKGWQYLDVFYSEKAVGTAPNQITAALPERFKIHTVYPEVSFRSVMGIG